MVRRILIVLVALVVLATGLFLGWAFGFPLLEGDRVYTSGDAYGFRIGMTRDDCFAVMRRDYKNDDVQVVWRRDAPHAVALRSFATSGPFPGDAFVVYRVPIASLGAQTAPLRMVERWDINLPATWVNTVYLSFQHDRLHRIQRSRWIMERP